MAVGGTKGPPPPQGLYCADGESGVNLHKRGLSQLDSDRVDQLDSDRVDNFGHRKRANESGG